MSKCKWKAIKEQYQNQQELIDLLKNSTYIDLAKQWDCHVDVVYTLRKNLGIRQKRTDIEVFLKKYPKEVLEDLYFNKYDRHLKTMADGLDIHQTTLSQIFEKLGIIQKPHHLSEYPEVRQILSAKAIARAKIKSPLKHITKDPNWREKADKARVLAGTARRPHKENRKIADISRELLISEVLQRGVNSAAKFFKISQSTLREWCWKNNVTLISGPREFLTNTEEYKTMARKRAVNSVLKMPFINTSIELALQAELTQRNIKFETQKPLIDLTIPDIVIEPKIVIYADGCWWHCCSTCNLKYTNFEARGRDQYVNTGLLRAGYKVFRFWEHEIKKDVKACVDQIEAHINEQKA